MVKLCAAILTGAALSFWTVIVLAQSKAPYALFEYSSITGSGNRITAARVPVVNAAGLTLFKDVTVMFDVDSDGSLSLSSGYPLVDKSPELQVSTFQAGRYIGPRNIANGKAVIRVGGPTPTPGGGTVWSLLAADDADRCTYPASSTWYVGPIENNPQATRLQRAGTSTSGIGIKSTAWSYGISGVAPDSSCFSLSSVSSNWRNGSLIGLSQSGNTLTIASFTDSGKDYSSPVDQITYILAP